MNEAQSQSYSGNRQLQERVAQLETEVGDLQDQLQRERQQRQSIETELRLNEQRLRRIFDYSNDAIFVIDPERDRILEANRRAAEMLGYSREELLASVRVSAVHPDEMAKMQAFARAVCSQGYGWTNELTCSTQSGRKLLAEISASAIPFDNGEYILALVRDVTERKHSEMALRQSEARFRAFADNAPDAFFTIALDGRIVDVNQRACEMLGYPREALLQRPVGEIEIGRTPEELAQFRQQLEVNQPQVCEGIHRRRDGSVFPVETNICRFESGEQLLDLALARDISDRKQAEAATARLAEIGEFTATIVHEVRSPLTTVLMGLESFQNLELPERSRLRLSLALEEADRLKRLLGEILQYSREQTLQTDELELNALVGEIRERVMEFPEIQPDRLEVISTVPEVRIQGDRDKLIQVFVNLIRNAGEAVENDEPITWRIDRDRHPCQVCASVRNGGSPIPAEILAKIGTPFVTTKPEGNGLGLAIVKRIVEAHGARLDIESDAKRGTTVRVIFPTLERMLS